MGLDLALTCLVGSMMRCIPTNALVNLLVEGAPMLSLYLISLQSQSLRTRELLFLAHLLREGQRDALVSGSPRHMRHQTTLLSQRHNADLPNPVADTPLHYGDPL